MPAKNTIKTYLDDGYYHIYNRGVEKRVIFIDQQDYAVFLSYLKEYLLPKDVEGLTNQLTNPKLTPRERESILRRLRLNNFNGKITLLAYCLMPNHFHFFLHQSDRSSIDQFMQSLCTRYTMYFNKKYSRVGSLYQGVYKAVRLISEIQFIYLGKYIHKQALSEINGKIVEKQPCSYFDYLGERNTPWVHSQKILDLFSKNNPQLSYQNFVLDEENEELLESITQGETL